MPKVKHWGGFEDDSDKRKEAENVITPLSKLSQFQEIPEVKKMTNGKKLLVKNPLVTQTVEVSNQTEMISSLIDTYSSKNGFNYILTSPCQLMPNIDFPPCNSSDINIEKSFAKPIWFVPPKETPFTQGQPTDYCAITKPTVLAALRKSLCGLLRVAGFAEINESALVTYVDAVDQFYKLLTEQIKHTLVIQGREVETEVDVVTLEQSYFNLTSKSLTCLHNHVKNDIFVRNKQEIAEFKLAMNEYDKLLQENNLKDYINFLDPGSENTAGNIAQSGKQISMSGFLEQEGLLDGDLLSQPDGTVTSEPPSGFILETQN